MYCKMNNIYSLKKFFLVFLLLPFFLSLLIKPVHAQTESDVSFLYDASGQRIVKDVSGGDTTYYVSSHLEVVIDNSGNVTWKKNYSSGGKLIAVRDSSSGLSHIHQDHLGSTAIVTDSTGEAVSGQVYFPYGETRNTFGILPTERQFTGQVSDMEETGLYYYNARYYNPTIAKFTQADPVNDQLNRYAYVGNNPIVFNDPSGNVLDQGGGTWGEAPGVTSSPLGDMFDSINTYNQIMIEHTFPDVVPALVTVAVLGPAVGACAVNPACAAIAVKAVTVIGAVDDVIDTLRCVGGDVDACGYILAAPPGAGLIDDMYMSHLRRHERRVKQATNLRQRFDLDNLRVYDAAGIFDMKATRENYLSAYGKREWTIIEEAAPILDDPIYLQDRGYSEDAVIEGLIDKENSFFIIRGTLDEASLECLEHDWCHSYQPKGYNSLRGEFEADFATFYLDGGMSNNDLAWRIYEAAGRLGKRNLP